jgi:hypothetical protein
MLKVASTTSRTMCKLARCADAIFGCGNNSYDIGAIKRATSASNFNFDFLARNCVSYKYHGSKMAGDEVSAMSDFLYGCNEAIPNCQRNAIWRILLVLPT